VIVVSDSSPLITLARAQHLELLREFYGQVAIPREVHEEVTVAGAGLPGAEEVRRASWIQVQPNPSEPPAAVKAACSGLGGGERGSIYLALSLSAEMVLIARTEPCEAGGAPRRVPVLRNPLPPLLKPRLPWPCLKRA
jgi:predicted nucleic acid-binding protein